MRPVTGSIVRPAGSPVAEKMPGNPRCVQVVETGTLSNKMTSGGASRIGATVLKCSASDSTRRR